MLALFIVLMLQLEQAVGAGETGNKALKFGEDASSYIRFSPDMRSFQNALSVCSWVRKLGSVSYPCLFSYSSSEILISDNGRYNRIFSSTSLDSLNSRFTAPQGEWFHQCHTWALQTRTFSVYFNGQLVGTTTTPSGRTLTQGGLLIIGNVVGGHSVHAFGGELYQLNVYSKELSSSEVHDMAAGGLCSGGEKLHDETRQLKWEEILQQTRTGNVREIESGCSQDDDVTEQNELAKDLTETKSQLNQTEHRLNETRNELNETRNELNETRNEMEETKQQLSTTAEQLNRTEEQLSTTTRELEEATKQLENITECVQDRAAITQWDLLNSEPFFNNVFTQDLYMKLSSSWDLLEDFVGVRMTNSVINLFKAYHKQVTCDRDDEI